MGMRMKRTFLPIATIALILPLAAGAQAPAPAPAQGTPDEKAEEGIPVKSEAVRKACAPCHTIDAQNRMSRISYRRTTPEGWQETIRRMVSLNNLRIEPDEARRVLKYLANDHGLAPEEARPALFEVERRMIDYKYTDRDTEATCSKCHSMGRVLLQRRTKEEWELLVAMHRGYYPLVDFQAFRRSGPPQREPGSDGRPPDNRHPMEKAIAHLSPAFPLRTPEWSAWAPAMRPPRLEGRWSLRGYHAGLGPLYGSVTIKPGPAGAGEDELVTETRYVYARSGRTVARTGRAVVYTGYQWRGRSFEGPNQEGALREVMFVERDWREMSGRWYTGAYDELGLDIHLQRAGSDPLVEGADVASLRTGSSAQRVRIYGANLPARLEPSQVAFGAGVRVARVVESGPDRAVVEVDVAADASVGPRDLSVASALRPAALVVYDRIDSLKVLPAAGLARNGGVQFPKQMQQFEAVAYHNGPDGKPDTKDDLSLGIVDVAWSLEEYAAIFGDDDAQFVGTIDAAGLFTPNVDGPNPKRRNNANNYGDVWVVATLRPGSSTAKQIRARAHLVVTVPLYMRWDQPEVAR